MKRSLHNILEFCQSKRKEMNLPEQYFHFSLVWASCCICVVDTVRTQCFVTASYHIKQIRISTYWYKSVPINTHYKVLVIIWHHVTWQYFVADCLWFGYGILRFGWKSLLLETLSGYQFLVGVLEVIIVKFRRLIDTKQLEF